MAYYNPYIPWVVCHPAKITRGLSKGNTPWDPKTTSDKSTPKATISMKGPLGDPDPA